MATGRLAQSREKRRHRSRRVNDWSRARSALAVSPATAPVTREDHSPTSRGNGFAEIPLRDNLLAGTSLEQAIFVS
jgi:hypothetical protein